ncbi:ORF8 [Cnidium closterovirus 1]|nr:ORF8 [Cnidium closterovirus 1]
MTLENLEITKGSCASLAVVLSINSVNDEVTAYECYYESLNDEERPFPYFVGGNMVLLDSPESETPGVKIERLTKSADFFKNFRLNELRAVRLSEVESVSPMKLSFYLGNDKKLVFNAAPINSLENVVPKKCDFVRTGGLWTNFVFSGDLYECFNETLPISEYQLLNLEIVSCNVRSAGRSRY